MKNLIELLVERSKLTEVGITFVEKPDQESYLSYNDLYRTALEQMASFQAAGLQPGDELIFQLDDNQTFIVAFWACVIGGIVPVPLTVGRTDDHKQKLVNVWGVVNNPYLYTDEDNFGRIREFVLSGDNPSLAEVMENRTLITGKLPAAAGNPVVHTPDPDELAYIQFSSGSTGSPKGVMLTHRNLLCNVEAIAEAANYTPQDSLVSWMPLTHDMGLIGLHLNPIFTGMPQCLIPTTLFVRKPAIWMDMATKYKASILGSPNFGYRYLLKHTRLENQEWELSSVRVIYNGAEPISEELCHEFMHELAPFGLRPEAMCPVYGLAEATLAVTISRMQDSVRSIQVSRDILNAGDKIVPVSGESDNISFVNVGTPIKYLSVRIGDAEGSEQPEGTIGHLLIKGGSVTSGYFNNPEATAEVMKPGGWLDTGDLGFVKDGCLYVTGRAKDIFFVNGQNYYPHDIERIAEEVDQVELNKIAIGGAYNRDTRKEEVIAFVFHRGKLPKFLSLSENVRMHINSRAGIELDRVIPVTDIPRTTSGKLQRFKLLQRFKKGEYADVEKELDVLRSHALIRETPVEPPATDTERMLLDMWKETLGRSEIGVTHRFFTLGGNSLKAAEIGMKLLRDTGVELSFATLYHKQTVRELAEVIDHSEKNGLENIPAAPAREWHPVSPAQRRLYFAWHTSKESTAYNTPFAFDLRGAADPDRIEAAIRQIIARHDSLRMTFKLADGEPVFRIQAEVPFQLSRQAVAEDRLQESLKSQVLPFDLDQAPLIRASLMTVEENRHVLFIDIHHIVSDGVSMYLFMGELLALCYGSEEISHPAAPYTDYAHWQNQVLASGTLDDQKAYWLEQLSGELPVLDLPADYSRPGILNTSGEKLALSFERPVIDKLRSLAEAQDCSMHALIFACYTLLLSKYSGQSDMITGLPVAGRNHPDILTTHGMFVNNLPVRTRPDASQPFTHYLQTVRTTLLQALENQDYPFNSLVQDVGGRSDASRNPLFDTMFVYQNMGMPASPENSPAVSAFYFDPGVSKFDLSMEVFDHEGSLTYRLEYAKSLFQRDTIVKMAGHFNELIREVIDEPEKCLGNISLLSQREYRQSMVLFNQTEEVYPDNTPVHALITEKASETPDAMALHYKGQQVTYATLEQRASQMAALLAANGVGRGDVVGLWMPRTPEYITAVLGVLKAGACFVPMDKDLPGQRISYILNDSKCKLLLTTRDLVGNATAWPDSTQVLLTEELNPEAYEGKQPDLVVSPDDLAYIIYTSGTTGGPKGVMITHRSLVNYGTWAARTYVRDERVDFPLYSSISFDLTITSVFTPLLTGNAIHIYEDSHGLLIEDIIRDNTCGVIKLTPSHLKIVAERITPDSLQDMRLKRLIVGGEALETHLAQRIHQLFGGKVEILNEYGPTEATVGCMIHTYNPADDRAQVPVGKPAANTRIYLLDESLNPVTTGVKGEMYIAGDGLAAGYLYNAPLTDAKFVADPFAEGEKMYRTGDIARRLPDGNIEFIGRADEQVKVNGHRIEPAEIERGLRQHESVKEALVLLRTNETGNPMLVAYAEAAEGSERADEAAFRSFLAGQLPYYMIPSRIVRVEQWPLTTNGKVDHRALPAPDTITDDQAGSIGDSEVAELLLDAWKGLFGRDDLTVNHNFFEIGGDSIKAVQIAGRIMEKG
ncbi:MAG: amino acid adenylation domain-containing protein, partial [Cyclobacteriaceae bacterium]